MQKVRKRVLPSKKQESPEPASEDNSDGDSDVQGNAGWADSIAKVLNTTKPKSKKTLVLSRAKKLKADDGESDKKKKSSKGYDFEVDGAIEEKEEKAVKIEEPETKVRKNKPLSLRVKPNWKDLDRERTLRKVATRGVVQLFNAVRIEQKDLRSKLELAGPLDSRKEAVLNNINKKKFLDVLMGGKRAKSEAVDNPLKKEEDESSSDDDSDEPSGSSKKKSEWNVLRPDYMTNKKIKHWDEEEDNKSENDNSDEGGGGSDDDDE